MSYMGHAPLVIIMTAQLCGLYRRRGVLRALSEAKQSVDGARFQGRFDSRRIQSLAGVSIVVGLTAYCWQ